MEASLWIAVGSLAGGAILYRSLVETVQRHMMYFPRRYAATLALPTGVERIEFVANGKPQTGFLLGGKDVPERVWWLFGGNGSLALGWYSVLEGIEVPGVACVLVDYPGYGFCQGNPGPEAIRHNVDTLHAAVAERWGMDGAELSRRSSVLGHSLGAAVALDTAARHGMSRAMLLAPFTTMQAMAQRVVGRFLARAVRHRYDNREALRVFLNRGDGQVRILHGVGYELIPDAMSRELAALAGERARLELIPEAGHSDLVWLAQGAIHEELRAGGERDALRR